MNESLEYNENRIRKRAAKKAKGIAKANLSAAVSILKSNPTISNSDLLVETLKSRNRLFPISEEIQMLILRNSESLPELIMNIAVAEIDPSHIPFADDRRVELVSKGIVEGVQNAYKIFDKKLR